MPRFLSIFRPRERRRNGERLDSGGGGYDVKTLECVDQAIAVCLG